MKTLHPGKAASFLFFFAIVFDICATRLLFFHCKEGGAPVSAVVCLIIGLLALLGFWCALQVWRDLIKENVDLGHFWEEIKDAPQNQCKKFIEEFIESKKSASSHLGDRVKLMLDFQKEGKGLLPHIDDWDEISALKEHGKFPAFFLGACSSTLLILGIFGTLWGIHSFLPLEQNDRLNLSQLKPALAPSALAVGSTVLLFLCRSLYQRQARLYFGQLNHVTLARLAPILQPITQTNLAYNKLAEQLKGCQSFSKLSRCLDSLNAAQRQLKESLDAYDRQLSQWEPFPKQWEKITDTLEASEGRTLELYEALSGQVQQLDEDKHRLLSDIGYLAEAAQQFHKGIRDTYQGLSGFLEAKKGNLESWEQIGQALAPAGQILQQADAMAGKGILLEEIGQTYRELIQNIKAIDSFLSPVKQQGETASQSAVTICQYYQDTQQEADAMKKQAERFHLLEWLGNKGLDIPKRLSTSADDIANKATKLEKLNEKLRNGQPRLRPGELIGLGMLASLAPIMLIIKILL